MLAHPLKRLLDGLSAVVLAGSLLAMPSSSAPDTGKMPGKVMDTLKAKFPNAEIRKWTRETEGGMVLYDIELTQRGRKFEADIREDGTIHNWEREIALKDLPAAVRNSVDTRYPKAAIKQIMAITAVKQGEDALEKYEITLETAGKKQVEVTVAPDGRVLEDSGENK